MQPLVITIKGDFTDSNVYSGKLYLWKIDNTVSIYSWYEIIEYINKKIKERIILNHAFLDNDYLYEHGFNNILADDEFKSLYLKKYNRVAKTLFILTEEEISKFKTNQQDMPGGIIPHDTEIYSNNLYFCNDNGLFQSTINTRNKYHINIRPNKLWDCNILNLKANKYPQIALSAGNEGLYELSLNEISRYSENEIEPHIFKISEKYSAFANYAFLSIVNSSLDSVPFIALFNWEEHEKHIYGKPKYIRKYSEILSLSSTSKRKNYFSWGIDDKIYEINKGNLAIKKFNNYAKPEKNESYLTEKANIYLKELDNEILNAGTSYFGNIIETDEYLLIFESNNNITKIDGPIVRWRAFPRSKNFQNQLHVILEECIRIYSFNSDYFVNQSEKTHGIMKIIPPNNKTKATRSYLL
ncbi:hypothetical protein LPTSP2_38910 [Leptospira ellinghausenii]|uniref:Uncharacterized protein n=1 Tax=Leptospira ellinghausenii TaxID=1917822 RepID=A0A2P2DIX5_9LEPT|nr:hypothetical protein [Leptospira ellinghausenii]GBF44588.1 hypothetical protein LPTSP2_38910 [Leptospira ellinghausenii]